MKIIRESKIGGPTVDEVLNEYRNGYVDEFTTIYDSRFDAIYLQYQRGINDYPELVPYLYGDRKESLSCDDIQDRLYDLHEFMEGDQIIDLEGMLRKYPEIIEY